MEWGGDSLVPGLLPRAPHPLLSALLRFLGISFEIFAASSNEVFLFLPFKIHALCISFFLNYVISFFTGSVMYIR